MIKPEFTWSDIEKIEDWKERCEKAIILSKYEIDIELGQMRRRIHQEQIQSFLGTGYVPPYPFKD